MCRLDAGAIFKKRCDQIDIVFLDSYAKLSLMDAVPSNSHSMTLLVKRSSFLFETYLVDFPGVLTHSDINKTILRVSEMEHRLVLQARILSFSVLDGEAAGDFEDAVSVEHGRRSTLAVSVEEEALVLLDFARSTTG